MFIVNPSTSEVILSEKTTVNGSELPALDYDVEIHGGLGIGGKLALNFGPPSAVYTLTSAQLRAVPECPHAGTYLIHGVYTYGVTNHGDFCVIQVYTGSAWAVQARINVTWNPNIYTLFADGVNTRVYSSYNSGNSSVMFIRLSGGDTRGAAGAGTWGSW